MIFYGGYYSEAGRLKKQLTDGQVSVRFLSGDGVARHRLRRLRRRSRRPRACRSPAPASWPPRTPRASSASSPRPTRPSGTRPPGTYSTEGYDAANILIKGIKARATPPGPRCSNYVENLGTYEGAGKAIEFEANGNIKAGDVFVYEFQAGKPTVLGTTEQLIG